MPSRGAGAELALPLSPEAAASRRSHPLTRPGCAPLPRAGRGGAGAAMSLSGRRLSSGCRLLRSRSRLPRHDLRSAALAQPGAGRAGRGEGARSAAREPEGEGNRGGHARAARLRLRHRVARRVCVITPRAARAAVLAPPTRLRPGEGAWRFLVVLVAYWALGLRRLSSSHSSLPSIRPMVSRSGFPCFLLVALQRFSHGPRDDDDDDDNDNDGPPALTDLSASD